MSNNSSTFNLLHSLRIRTNEGKDLEWIADSPAVIADNRKASQVDAVFYVRLSGQWKIIDSSFINHKAVVHYFRFGLYVRG